MMRWSAPWQVGIELALHQTPPALTAIAIARLASEYVARSWWRTVFDESLFKGGLIKNREAFCQQLRPWVLQLPRQIRVFTAFPPVHVMQKLAKLSIASEGVADLWGIETAVKHQFPLPEGAVAVDYVRPTEAHNDTMIVYGVRKCLVENWKEAFETAGLPLESIELTPCALRRIARYAKVDSEALLIHREENGFLVSSPLNMPLQYAEYGYQVPIRLILRNWILHRTLRLTEPSSLQSEPVVGSPLMPVAWSGIPGSSAPADCHGSDFFPPSLRCHPGSATPENAAAFSIALGLALRAGACESF